MNVNLLVKVKIMEIYNFIEDSTFTLILLKTRNNQKL